MFLNTLVIDTYMENKEEWGVALVLGFVLLLNSNSFTGNAYAGDRAFNLQNFGANYKTIRNVEPSGYSPTRPAYNPYITSEIVGGARGSGYYGSQGLESIEGLVTSPPRYGTPGAGLTPEAGQYSRQYDPSVKYPIGDKSNYRSPGQGIGEQRPYVRQ